MVGDSSDLEGEKSGLEQARDEYEEWANKRLKKYPVDPEEQRREFGNFLARIRNSKKLDSDTYATRLHLGNDEYLSYEQGERIPDENELNEWAQQLGLTDEDKLILRNAAGYATQEEERKVLMAGLRAMAEEDKLNGMTPRKILPTLLKATLQSFKRGKR